MIKGILVALLFILGTLVGSFVIGVVVVAAPQLVGFVLGAFGGWYYMKFLLNHFYPIK